MSARYEIIRQVACGGMAEVLLARRTLLEGPAELVVLKRVLPHLSQNESFLRMFATEARLASQLRHPNIVSVVDVGEMDHLPFIAMERLDGADLLRLLQQCALRRQTLGAAVGLAVVSLAARGLGYAHRARSRDGRALKVIHRDVSPHNIFVTRDGQVKLLDFGIAKSQSQAGLTGTGQVKGKVSYMSPEQIRAQPIDQRSDLWSLGVVLWEAVAGEKLFSRDNDAATLHAILHDPVPRLDRVDVPGFDALVDAVLQRDPARRVRTAEEIADRIDTMLHAMGVTDVPRVLAARVSSLIPALNPALDAQRPTVSRAAEVVTFASSTPVLSMGAGAPSGRLPLEPRPASVRPPAPRAPTPTARAASDGLDDDDDPTMTEIPTVSEGRLSSSALEDDDATSLHVMPADREAYGGDGKTDVEGPTTELVVPTAVPTGIGPRRGAPGVSPAPTPARPTPNSATPRVRADAMAASTSAAHEAPTRPRTVPPPRSANAAPAPLAPAAAPTPTQSNAQGLPPPRPRAPTPSAPSLGASATPATRPGPATRPETPERPRMEPGPRLSEDDPFGDLDVAPLPPRPDRSGASGIGVLPPPTMASAPFASVPPGADPFDFATRAPDTLATAALPPRRASSGGFRAPMALLGSGVLFLAIGVGVLTLLRNTEAPAPPAAATAPPSPVESAAPRASAAPVAVPAPIVAARLHPRPSLRLHPSSLRLHPRPSLRLHPSSLRLHPRPSLRLHPSRHPRRSLRPRLHPLSRRPHPHPHPHPWLRRPHPWPRPRPPRLLRGPRRLSKPPHHALRRRWLPRPAPFRAPSPSRPDRWHPGPRLRGRCLPRPSTQCPSRRRRVACLPPHRAHLRPSCLTVRPRPRRGPCALRSRRRLRGRRASSPTFSPSVVAVAPSVTPRGRLG